jgi:hypothetical protein
MTCRRNVEKLCKSIYSPPALCQPTIIHGLTHEIDRRKKFQEVTGHEVTVCGLVVSEAYPFLAASPDGLVGNNHVLEIKCPYVARKSRVDPSSVPYIERKEDRLQLKCSSHYYDQVQGQMAITGRTKAYFVIYTFADIAVIEIDFSEDYWTNSMLPKLQLFYQKHYKKYLSSLL